LAFLVGVDFDLWIDVHLLGHPGLVVAASCSNATTSTGRVRREMNAPYGFTHSIIGANPNAHSKSWGKQHPSNYY
jgi:hypothetical protein